MTIFHIPLGARSTVIDRADESLTRGFHWKLLANGYVMAQRGNFTIYLHRLIAGAGPDELVDHIDQDPLNNRTNNLRIATKGQNGANRGADRRRLGTSSHHKGVSWQKARSCWCAYIHVNGKTRYLGRFPTEGDAALAYNKAALETWGEFARLNDVPTRGSMPMGDAQ